MERSLLLMRHAKSSWKGSFSDHERPLNDRGRRSADTMATELQRRGWSPDLVLLSDSHRTTETVDRMEAALGVRWPRSARPDLYLPAPAVLIDAVQAAPEEVRTLLVVAHNPACEDVIQALTGRAVVMRTACIARLVPRHTWAAPDGWRLDALVHPGDDDED